MTKRFCDICGNELAEDWVSELFIAVPGVDRRFVNIDISGEKRWDCCGNCMRAVVAGDNSQPVNKALAVLADEHNAQIRARDLKALVIDILACLDANVCIGDAAFSGDPEGWKAQISRWRGRFEKATE